LHSELLHYDANNRAILIKIAAGFPQPKHASTGRHRLMQERPIGGAEGFVPSTPAAIVLQWTGTRTPAPNQFCKPTSVGEHGCEDGTAATNTSAESIHKTKTGRILEATPFVKGISASQSSPGCGIVVKTFVLWGVAVEEGPVVASSRDVVAGRRRDFQSLAGLVNPKSQFDKVRYRKFFNCPFDFLNLAHEGILTLIHEKTSHHI
jgi:hypothetical protein